MARLRNASSFRLHPVLSELLLAEPGASVWPGVISPSTGVTQDWYLFKNNHHDYCYYTPLSAY